jgi:hypothetical protein
MGPDQALPPGHAWLEIIKRPNQAAFALAFTKDVVLDTSVASAPIVGAVAIWAFFDATGAMYDQIAFVHETRSSSLRQGRSANFCKSVTRCTFP